MRFETYVDIDPHHADRVLCVVSHYSKYGWWGAHMAGFDNGLNARVSIPKRITRFKRYVRQYVRRSKERYA